jgi:hypothetical protein
MKISPVRAKFYADGRTDMTKLIVAFPNFANAPQIDDSMKMTVHSNRSCRKSNALTLFAVELGEKKNAWRHDGAVR